MSGKEHQSMSYINESIIYNIYPLGYCGAPRENDGQLNYRLDTIYDVIPHLKKRGVKPQTVDAELIDPEFCRAEQIADDVLVLQVELDEIVVTCPSLIPEGVAVGALTVEVEVLEPAAVG